MTTLPTGRVDISPDHVAEVFAELDSLYMEAAEDSPTERAALEAMSVLEAMRSALTARDELIEELRQRIIWAPRDETEWKGELIRKIDAILAKGETK